ncbi:MAG: alpha-glucosidase C-terminal domain-containing protein [Elusimicrobia bacterium]|nr:alpha-glucosidase C-terminal domain-containing protein [Elusimicrobiota bacterium]
MSLEPTPLRLPRPWNEDIVYMVLIDRFHRGASAGPAPQPPFHGGNLAGVLEKLDYLEDLGVTALWLSPVIKNQRDGYHGYWPVDFYAVDPRFGTMEELQALVKECHRRGLKVLLDMVINHAGYDHPMAQDPRYRRWFHRGGEIRWFSQRSLEKGSLHGLPDFAQEKDEVAQFLIEMSLWWLEKTGVDGFRLDAVKHVPASFWKRFSREAHAKGGPGFLLLGEVLRGVPRYIARYQRDDGIDSVFDVPFADTARSALCRDSEEPGPGLLERLSELWREYRTMLLNEILRKLTAGGSTDMRWFSALARAESAYARPEMLAPFIDNHDMSRFASEAHPPLQRLKMALALLMTWRGIPVITYGTECCMPGRTRGDHRSPMRFGADPGLRDYVRSLIRLRRATPALLSGAQREVFADKEVYAFLREAEGSSVLTALNNSRLRQKRFVGLPKNASGGVWQDAFTGKELHVQDGALELRLEPRSARILVERAA